MSRKNIPTILEKGREFPGIRAPPTFRPFVVILRAVMAPVGVSFAYANVLQ